jgi:spermidine/putrescine-binding protein
MRNGIRLAFMLSAGLVSHSVIADEVRVYIWEEYLADEVVHQFETETGHTVKQYYFESEKVRDEVVSSGRAESYDLFIIDGYTLQVFGQNGFVAPVSPSQMVSPDNISADAWKACSGYGVPYSWGTMGIGYRSSRVENAPTSWRDLFEFAKNHPKRVTIPLDDLDTIGVALLALGHQPFSDDQAALRQAFELLSESKEYLIDYRTAVGYAIENKQQSQLDMALIYTGETYTLSEATGQDDWVYSVPKEGSLLWHECLASVSDRPFSAAAQAFVDFLNRPEIAAKNAEEVWIATTNQAALSLVSEEYLQDSELLPDSEALARSVSYPLLGLESLRLRARIIGALSK